MNCNQTAAVSMLRRLIRWKDESQIAPLVEMGVLIPIPKSMRHAFHVPTECFKCDREEFGIWWAIKNKLRIRKITA